MPSHQYLNSHFIKLTGDYHLAKLAHRTDHHRGERNMEECIEEKNTRGELPTVFGPREGGTFTCTHIPL